MWPFKSTVPKMIAKKNIKGLIKALGHTQSSDEAYPIVDGLAQIGERALPELVTALTKADDHTASWACQALGRIGDKVAVNPLIRALQREDMVRANAADALGKLGDTKAVEPLMNALEEALDEGHIGLTIIGALGDLGDRRAASALYDAARSGGRYVAREAGEALRELGTSFKEMDMQRTEGSQASGAEERSKKRPNEDNADSTSFKRALENLKVRDSEATQRCLDILAREWGLPSSHCYCGTLPQICAVLQDEWASHKRNGEHNVTFMSSTKFPDILDDSVIVIRMGRGQHWVGRTGHDSYSLLIHGKYYSYELPKLPEEKQPSGGTFSGRETESDGFSNAADREPWSKYAEYVSIEPGAPDSERRTNMRFQFLFSGSAEADRIISSLPGNLRSALSAPHHEGLPPPGAGPDVEGKYTVWYEGVSLTIGEGKDLMNRVVQAGGGIYEAFLTG